MVEAGVLEDPTVAAAVALHGWPTMPVGHISVRGGPVMASTDSGAIVIRGVGSHGAYPHRGIDPIVVAAHIITQFQTIPARTVDPLDSAVITVGSVHGGTICNVIPPECRMELTCRALNAATREHVREHVKRVAENTARSFGATADVQVKRGYPVMVNDPRLSDWVAAVGRQVLGADCVRTTDPPSMGAEDFAYYAQKVPCVMFRVGVRPPDRDTYPGLHNPGYDFNDDTLPVGIRMFSELTLRYWQDTPLAGEGL
jgi:amidohydrolase